MSRYFINIYAPSPEEFHDVVEGHGRIVRSFIRETERGAGVDGGYGHAEYVPHEYEPPTLEPLGNFNDLLSQVCQHGDEET